MKQINHYHVLLVDDEYYLRQALRRSFSRYSDEFRIVAEAADGIQALEMMQKHDIHVVITDIRMPSMDGLALAKRLHETRPDIPVVILTGYADFEYARQGINYGVISYLLKPVRTEEFETAISALKKRLSPSYQLLSDAETGKLGAKESVHQALRYMQEHYMEEIDIASLAESLGFHSAYLTRLFNRYVGESPLKYLTGLRINEAKKLLRDSSLSIAETGARVGYPDQFHFSKTFRRVTGMNPSAFRAQEQAENQPPS